MLTFSGTAARTGLRQVTGPVRGKSRAGGGAGAHSSGHRQAAKPGLQWARSAHIIRGSKRPEGLRRRVAIGNVRRALALESTPPGLVGSMWGTAQLAPIGRILVLAGWGLWLGVAGPALADAPTTDSDVAVRSLLDEDPKLSELVRRDPALVDALRDDPGLAGRLALKPSLTQRLIIALSHPWVIFGFAAQFMFMMRFVVQWISSERKEAQPRSGGLLVLLAGRRPDAADVCYPASRPGLHLRAGIGIVDLRPQPDTDLPAGLGPA